MSEPGAALYAADELSEKVGRLEAWAVRLAREEQVELQRGTHAQHHHGDSVGHAGDISGGAAGASTPR